MVWPAVIAGVAGLVGGLLANRSSAKEAQQNREFQEGMSRTAHQREVADLRAAGLNPILSGTGGRGASTPTGSMAVQRDPITPAVQSALAATRLKQELKNMKTQRTTTEAQGWAAAATSDAQSAIAHNQRTQAQLTGEQLLQQKMQTKIMGQAQAGHMDAAKFWSSDPYAAKRRVDAAAETARILIPLTTPGHSAYGNRKRR